MLHAQLFERFLKRLRAPRSEVVVALPNPIDLFLIVLPFPLEGLGQDIVKRNNRFLPVALGVVVELGFAFRREFDLHVPRVGSSGVCVKRDSRRNGVSWERPGLTRLWRNAKVEWNWETADSLRG